MKITDDMIDRALLAYWGRRNLDRHQREKPWEPQQVESMRAALEAALAKET